MWLISTSSDTVVHALVQYIYLYISHNQVRTQTIGKQCSRVPACGNSVCTVSQALRVLLRLLYSSHEGLAYLGGRDMWEAGLTFMPHSHPELKCIFEQMNICTEHVSMCVRYTFYYCCGLPVGCKSPNAGIAASFYSCLNNVLRSSTLMQRSERHP